MVLVLWVGQDEIHFDEKCSEGKRTQWRNSWQEENSLESSGTWFSWTK